MNCGSLVAHCQRQEPCRQAIRVSYDPVGGAKGGHHPHRVTKRADPATPIVRPTAGFHTDLKDQLCNVQTNRRDIHECPSQDCDEA
jgi:hypothetical protein